MEISSQKLSRLLNGYVTVKVSEILSYEGILKSYDQYMNIVLQGAIRRLHTQNGDEIKESGLLIIRGSNVICVSAKTLPTLPLQTTSSSRLQVGIGNVRTFGRGYADQ